MNEEGVATEQLAKLYRDGAEFDKAARCYRAILSMHQSSDISERVAEALLFLAHYYKDNKNYEVASICCSRLFEYPGQEKEEAKALLVRLIERKKERKIILFLILTIFYVRSEKLGHGLMLIVRTKKRTLSTIQWFFLLNSSRNGLPVVLFI